MNHPQLNRGLILRALAMFALLLAQPIPAAPPAPGAMDKPTAAPPQDKYRAQAEVKRGLEHLQLGQSNNSNDEYQLALQYFQRAADLSSAEGQFHVGRMHANGWGVKKDSELALQYFRKSADAKYPPAMGEIAAAYLSGTVLGKDEVEAARWSRMAADLGDAPSQKRLATMLRDGLGVKQDKREALTYFLKAATSGDNDAGWIVAKMYQEGDGTRADMERATTWFSKLAERGHAESQYQLVSIDPELYRKVAKIVPVKELQKNPKLVGFPIQLEGRVIAGDDKGWKLEAPLQGGPQTTFAIDTSKLTGSKVRTGMAVAVYGMPIDGATIRALVADLVPPEFVWKYALAKPKGGVVGGKVQKFMVEGSITNTGRQAIKQVEANVRMYQVSSPNNESKTLVIKGLAPGETKQFSVTFTLYNFQFIGATSTPRVKFEVTDYDF